ncbi:MAG: DNA integrity scanning protein DisA nucleotide-binding domain protein [Candidatus ainarchaeum sp.]|nr:DNA integrity scanning protein DisA nucleotide-binding domain protein [Candidatus ainarchaeum sp.]
MNKKETIAQVMELTTEMAKGRKGSFVILTKNNISSKYEMLYPDLFKGKNINLKDKETKTLIMNLLLMDGAVVMDYSGKIITYGAKIKKTRIVLGHGTRHSAARGISENKDVLAIISSEEDGRIRVFKEGKLVGEINPETGKNKQFFEKLGELFSKPDIQVATAGGVASLLLKLNPIMAGAVFTGSWIITRYGLVSMKDFLHTGKLIITDKTTEIKKSQKTKIKKK